MNPERIEGLIKHDAEVLVLWREAMKGQAGRPSKESNYNVKELSAVGGNSRSYTVSRLQREAPDPRERGANFNLWNFFHRFIT